MAKATLVDNAARQCAASASTQVFGLVLSGAQIVKFDNDGNAKASEALKEVTVPAGKKVKARVTGMMEHRDTVKVASIELKGKRFSPLASSTPSFGR
jgi:hypothetical protein